MIQDLKQQKGRPLDRAYLIDAFELCLICARVYARYRWRYADYLTLRIVMDKYMTVSDYLHRDDEDKSPYLPDGGNLLESWLTNVCQI
mgnify:CR=1 FL=1